MALPVNPFARELNFPAGASAWSGQPLKLVPASDYFTPNTKPAAEEHNYELNKIESTAIDAMALRAINGWNPSQVANSLQSTYLAGSVVWSNVLLGWILLLHQTGGGATSVYEYFSANGRAWTISTTNSGVLATGTIFEASMANNPADVQYGNIGIAANASGGMSIHTFAPDTGGIPTNYTPTWSSMPTAGCYSRFNNKWVFIGCTQSGGTATGVYEESTNGDSTWTDLHTSLPAAWQTSTNHAGKFFQAHTATVQVVATAGVTAGVDTARLMTRTGAGAWSDITPSIFTNNIVTALTYDPANALWGVVLWNGTAGSVYASADLSTWFLVGTTNVKFSGLGCIGRNWITSWAGPGSTAGFDATRLMVFNNAADLVAGYISGPLTPYIPVGLQLGINATLPLFVSNGNQLALWTPTEVDISESAGFYDPGNPSLI